MPERISLDLKEMFGEAVIPFAIIFIGIALGITVWLIMNTQITLNGPIPNWST